MSCDKIFAGALASARSASEDDQLRGKQYKTAQLVRQVFGILWTVTRHGLIVAMASMLFAKSGSEATLAMRFLRFFLPSARHRDLALSNMESRFNRIGRV